MNEETRNNEIRDDELENVSGGSGVTATCPRCGGRYVKSVIGGLNAYVCESCSYTFYLDAISPSPVAIRPTRFC